MVGVAQEEIEVVCERSRLEGAAVVVIPPDRVLYFTFYSRVVALLGCGSGDIYSRSIRLIWPSVGYLRQAWGSIFAV